MLVVFSDLDGTLLDHHTYSHAPAAEALTALKRGGHVLVLCSSKTQAEMTPLHAELGLDGPIICENGGGIFAPANHPITSQGNKWQAESDGWALWPLGMSYFDLRERFGRFKDRFSARGFGDMSDGQVAELTGLSPTQAALAREREFNEPVLLPDAHEQEAEFTLAAKAEGLAVTRGGRFHHLLGGGDKGRAVELVAELYQGLGSNLVTAAIGDAPNDQPMLAAVDHPMQVARPGGGHAEMDCTGLVREPLDGPAGFNHAVLDLLGDLV